MGVAPGRAVRPAAVPVVSGGRPAAVPVVSGGRATAMAPTVVPAMVSVMIPGLSGVVVALTC